MSKDIITEINEMLEITEVLPTKVIDNDAIAFIENHFPDFKDDTTLITIIQALFDSCEKYGVSLSYKTDMADPVFVLRKGYISVDLVAISGRFQVFTDQTFATEDSWEKVIVEPAKAIEACIKEWKEQ